jgi:hypothetical protein
LTLGEDGILVGGGMIRPSLGDDSGFCSVCFRTFPLILFIDGISILSCWRAEGEDEIITETFGERFVDDEEDDVDK